MTYSRFEQRDPCRESCVKGVNRVSDTHTHTHTHARTHTHTQEGIRKFLILYSMIPQESCSIFPHPTHLEFAQQCLLALKFVTFIHQLAKREQNRVRRRRARPACQGSRGIKHIAIHCDTLGADPLGKGARLCRVHILAHHRFAQHIPHGAGDLVVVANELQRQLQMDSHTARRREANFSKVSRPFNRRRNVTIDLTFENAFKSIHVQIYVSVYIFFLYMHLNLYIYI